MPRVPRRKPRLTIPQILAWADSHHARTGRWPSCTEGQVPSARGETWRNISQALSAGSRGLPGGDTLPRLLARERGKRHPGELPRLTERQVAAWAQAHRARTGRWPTEDSGPVAGAPGESWSAVAGALQQGGRGLPRGSLPRLLARRCGARNIGDLPRLSEAQILCWADAHRAAQGSWPRAGSGPVGPAPGETWRAVDGALRQGGRGLPGGHTLAQLLAECRQVPNPARPPRLTERRILAWADAHRRRAGEWPRSRCGPVVGQPGETWYKVDLALRLGLRGPPGGDTLLRLVRRSGRDVPERRGRPRKSPAPAG
jgi:hypothetical protein